MWLAVGIGKRRDIHNAGVRQNVQYGLIEWQSSGIFSMQEK